MVLFLSIPETTTIDETSRETWTPVRGGPRMGPRPRHHRIEAGTLVPLTERLPRGSKPMLRPKGPPKVLVSNSDHRTQRHRCPPLDTGPKRPFRCDPAPKYQDPGPGRSAATMSGPTV